MQRVERPSWPSQDLITLFTALNSWQSPNHHPCTRSPSFSLRTIWLRQALNREQLPRSSIGGCRVWARATSAWGGSDSPNNRSHRSTNVCWSPASFDKVMDNATRAYTGYYIRYLLVWEVGVEERDGGCARVADMDVSRSMAIEEWTRSRIETLTNTYHWSRCVAWCCRTLQGSGRFRPTQHSSPSGNRRQARNTRELNEVSIIQRLAS